MHVRRDGADVAAREHERVVEDQHVLRLEARRGPEGEARPRDAVREAHEDVRRPRLVDRREVGAAAVARRERVGADLAAVPALLDAVVELRLGPGIRRDEVVDGALEGGLGDAAAGLPHASQGLLDARERAAALREGPARTPAMVFAGSVAHQAARYHCPGCSHKLGAEHSYTLRLFSAASVCRGALMLAMYWRKQRTAAPDKGLALLVPYSR